MYNLKKKLSKWVYNAQSLPLFWAWTPQYLDCCSFSLSVSYLCLFSVRWISCSSMGVLCCGCVISDHPASTFGGDEAESVLAHGRCPHIRWITVRDWAWEWVSLNRWSIILKMILVCHPFTTSIAFFLPPPCGSSSLGPSSLRRSAGLSFSQILSL